MQRWIALLALAHAALGTPVNSASAVNISHEISTKNAPVLVARRNRKDDRSTSSSSGEAPGSKQHAERGKADDSNSLEILFSKESSSSDDRRRPNHASREFGWRAWHRKCPSCPDDMVKKWRDPTIKWICGGYQRARRSFKSECMMQYRNCQDGTMFVKLHEHRCNEKAPGYNGGRHFFYDYHVALSDDNTSDEKTSDSSGTDNWSGDDDFQ